jgi:hypothetical protein
MEPARLLALVRFSIENCLQLERKISRVKRVDDAVGSLGNEISALKDVLNNVEKSARAVSTESLNGLENRNWQNVEWTLGECGGTLEKLHSTLDKALNTTRRSIFFGPGDK